MSAGGAAQESRQDVEFIEELEAKSKDLGAVVEFFQPPAVPGYGAPGDFALRLLDQNNDATDDEEFDKVKWVRAQQPAPTTSSSSPAAR